MTRESLRLSQTTLGLYRLSRISMIYSFYQVLLGGSGARARIVTEHICPKAGDRVLDLGCGGAEYLPFLGDVRYVGVDDNSDHIARARARFPESGRFICASVGEYVAALEETFDVILCLGLLHHLDDEVAQRLIAAAWNWILPGGRLIAVDPVFAPGQHRLARYLAAADSGRRVRTEAGYRELFEQTSTTTETHIHHDLLRVPYSHCVTIARC